MILTLFYFLIALFLLVTIHEYGHFLVARLCGVKVIRFSFGFGKVLFSWRDKHETEYVISAIPLGGYVKMLDESEDIVPPKLRSRAFNNQSVFARMAIVLAGPLFNFIFAFLAFFTVLLLGVYTLVPLIDSVKPHSIAAQAGFVAQQEIIGFNTHPIHSWQDFQYHLIPKLGSGETIDVHVLSRKDHRQKTIPLPLDGWNPSFKEDPLTSLGITPFIPKIPAVVGEAMADSVAQKAGFLPHDQIISVNNTPIQDWLSLVHFVKQHPNQTLTFQIKRRDQMKILSLTSGSQLVDGRQEGYLGLKAKQIQWPEKWIHFERQSPLHAARLALKQTIDLSLSTLVMAKRLLTGQVDLKNLSGPLGIAQGAGDSARNGLSSYLSFLGLISISLGVLNLLPIPVLDGGHFLFLLIELLCRRPLSAKSKTTGSTLGFIFIAMLMIMAIFNDFSRILS